MDRFERITIYGVGLIGGSLGLAIKKAFPKAYIYGEGRNKDQLKMAKKRGAINEVVSKLEDGARISNLIILATPIAEIISTLKEIGTYCRPGSVITDVGSTKAEICKTARTHLPRNVYFIGGHPMAGNERSGFGAADGDLISKATYLVCPNENVPKKVLEYFLEFIRAINAHPVLIDPEMHDSLVAYVSHLPQLLSTTLANLLNDKASTDMMIDLSSGGLRDMIRLAYSPYTIWKDICQTNEKNIQQTIGEYIAMLQGIKKRLTSPGMKENFFKANEFFEKYAKIKRS